MVPMSASDGTQMPRWPDILGFAQHAEQLAFESLAQSVVGHPEPSRVPDSLWVCDHFISDPGDRPIEEFTRRGRFSRRSPCRRKGSSWASW